MIVRLLDSYSYVNEVFDYNALCYWSGESDPANDGWCKLTKGEHELVVRKKNLEVLGETEEEAEAVVIAEKIKVGELIDKYGFMVLIVKRNGEIRNHRIFSKETYGISAPFFSLFADNSAKIEYWSRFVEEYAKEAGIPILYAEETENKWDLETFGFCKDIKNYDGSKEKPNEVVKYMGDYLIKEGR